MLQAQFLIESLAGDARRTRRDRVALVVLVTLLTVAGVAGVAVCGWLMVQAAIYGWQTTDWDRLDFGSYAFVPFLFLVMLPLSTAMQPRAWPGLARPILDALAHGETRLAPPAALQPEPPADVAAGQSVTLRRLRRVSVRNTRWRGLVLALVFIPIEFSMLAFTLPELLGQDSLTFQVFGLRLWVVELIAISVSVIAGLVVVVLAAGSFSQRLSVTADGLGISWHSGRHNRRAGTMRWHEVRAFYRMAYLASSASLRTVYIVDAGDRVFAWSVGAIAPIAQIDDSEKLAGIIRQNTQLPLRDISELAVKARQYQRRPDELLRLGLTPDAVAALRRVTHRSLRALWLLLPVVLLIILVFIVPLVGVQRLEDYQHGYFASLPQQIRAETPIYHDALAAYDYQWDVQQMGKDHGQASLSYRDGTYQMTWRSGCYVYSYPDDVFDDAAIEVTAVQHGKAADGNDGVGIVLRADSDQNMVVFVVSPTSGSWWLDHHLYNPQHPDDSWIYMDGGTSASVHTGAGASNTLLVLARGQTYLLYVNGHFLDAYSDRFHDQSNLLLAGYAGVYVNDGATTGIFSNFSVYPVQSPPSLNYV